MLTQKSKEHFVQITDHSVMVLRAREEGSRFVIEAFSEFPNGSNPKLLNQLQSFFDFKPRQYAPAYCTICPPGCFVRKATIDNSVRPKSHDFINKYIKENFSLEVDEYSIKLLSAEDGQELYPEEVHQKEVIFVGALNEEIKKGQSLLVDLGLYPKRIELSSIATLAGLVQYTNLMGTSVIAFELNYDSSQIFIVNKGQVGVLRYISYGLNEIIPLIQKELGLEDEASAKELLFSQTFDFADKGHVLLRKFCKEVQNAIDYYEVQTGLSVEKVFSGNLPGNLGWVSDILSNSIELDVAKFDYSGWLNAFGIDVDDSVNIADLDNRWFNLVGILTSCGHRVNEEEKV